ncbi:MAG: glycosyltransferase [Phycisphaerales bacterium]|nr:glycosyltransferase [Phycisphaerales bacterium]
MENDGHGDEGPLVSVVVAVYERKEKTIACAKSLVAQTFTNAEIIFVDDGSMDGTPDALEAIADTSARLPIQVIRNERNLGANTSRNRGCRAARGSLIAFLDSDCVASPTWLEELVRPFDDPQVGAVSGLVEDVCDGNQWELAFRGTHRLPHRGPSSRITSCNLCVRAALLPDGAWDETRPTRKNAEGTRPDTAISARCDEEGLNLGIRAAGWKVLAEPSAKVKHNHPYTRKSLFRQAFYGGCSACEIVYKYRLGPRKDLGPIAFSWVLLLICLPIAPFTSWWILLLPAGMASLAMAAISYNELANKGKNFGELLRAAPALFVYYHVRLTGYLWRRIQILLHDQLIDRVDPSDLGRSLPRAPESAR